MYVCVCVFICTHLLISCPLPLSRVKNNHTESAELAELCASLGSELNHNELVAAISVMDKDRNNKITYEEFYTWWACKYNDDKHAMMQV